MLLRLIRKDLILGGRVLAMNAGLFALWFCVILSQSNITVRAYAVVSGVVCAFLPVTLIGREDKCRAHTLTCSLPVTRSQVVFARYVEAVALGLAGLAVSFILGLVLPWSPLSPSQLFSPRSLLLAMSVAAVVTALVLPFLQRFGVWGLLGFLVVAQGLGMVGVLGAKLIGTVNPLGMVTRGIRASVIAHHVNLAAPLYAALSMATAVALLAFSYAAALVAFEHRDL